jgi:hypothetical protein
MPEVYAGVGAGHGLLEEEFEVVVLFGGGEALSVIDEFVASTRQCLRMSSRLAAFFFANSSGLRARHWPGLASRPPTGETGCYDRAEAGGGVAAVVERTTLRGRKPARLPADGGGTGRAHGRRLGSSAKTPEQGVTERGARPRSRGVQTRPIHTEQRTPRQRYDLRPAAPSSRTDTISVIHPMAREPSCSRSQRWHCRAEIDAAQNSAAEGYLRPHRPRRNTVGREPSFEDWTKHTGPSGGARPNV